MEKKKRSKRLESLLERWVDLPVVAVDSDNS